VPRSDGQVAYPPGSLSPFSPTVPGAGRPSRGPILIAVGLIAVLLVVVGILAEVLIGASGPG